MIRKHVGTERVMRTACSAVLAVGLCWPIGLAHATDDAVAASMETTDERVEASPVDRQAAILEAARAAEIEGVDALERYLDGEVLSDEDFLSIDVDALVAIDPDLAAEIADLQEATHAEFVAEDAIVDETEDASVDEAKPTYSDGTDDNGADDDDDDANSGTEAVNTDEAGISDIEIDAAVADDDAEHVDDTAAELAVARVTAPTVPAEADESSEAENAEQIEAPATTDGPEYPAWSYAGDTTLVSRSPGVSLTTSKFIAVIGEQARELAAENDLYASVMIAQAVLESGSGNSKLAQAPNFNLFGIKGSYGGRSVTMRTQEDDGTGSYYSVEAAFRRYPSYRESLEDYAALMSRALYLPAHKSATGSFAEACGYLEGTYATSTSYAAALEGIIVAYDLTRYDEPLGLELEGDYPAVVDADTGEVLGVGPAALAEWADELEAQERDSGGPGDAAQGAPGGGSENARELAVERRGLADLAAEAAGHLGADYVWGAAGEGGFDCSGLVQSSYATALGVALPRTTHYQCLLGEDVDFADLIVGDLVFFADAKGVVYHVGMYLGEGCYIESTVPGGVQVTAMEERKPTFAKRMLPTREVEEEGANASVESPIRSIPSSAGLQASKYLACIASELEFRSDTKPVAHD